MARKRHLHPAQGVYPGFCSFPTDTAQGSPQFLSFPTDTAQGSPQFLSFPNDTAQGGSRLLSFLPTGRYCLAFPADRRCLFLQASAENHNCLLHAYTRAPIRFFIGKKLRKLYTVAFKSLVLNHTRVYSWASKLYTNCSPTLHKTCRRHGPNSPLPRHRKRARREDCRTGLSRNVNAKSTDLDFGKKCIIFALLRSGLAANARLLRSFFAVYGPPKSLEGRLAGST